MVDLSLLPIKLHQFFGSQGQAVIFNAFLNLPRTQAKRKRDGSNVLGLDVSMQRALSEFIRTNISNRYHILGEEDDPIWPPQEDTFWLLDPLDGTNNVSMGSMNFGVTILFVHNRKPVFSYSYLPAHLIAQHVWAMHGKGAWMLWGGKVMRLEVTETSRLEESIILFEGSAGKIAKNEFFRALALSCRRSRPSLSPAWGGPLVAMGGLMPEGASAIVCLENKPWDNLTLVPFVAEAGGRVTDFCGNPITLENCANFVGSNGHLHDAILALNKRVAQQ